MVTVMYITVPQEFSSGMNQQHLLTFLNSKGISYKVCVKLKGKTEKADML